MEELNGFDELNANTPKHIERYVSLSMDIIDKIHNVMQEKKIQQSTIAKRLGKSESEISKWLSGVNNFTLKSIAKLEEAINAEILNVVDSKVSGTIQNIHFREIPAPSRNQSLKRIHLKQKVSKPVAKRGEIYIAA